MIKTIKKVKIPLELIRETEENMICYIPLEYQRAFRLLGITKLRISISFNEGDLNE